jgi:hypothetical protein
MFGTEMCDGILKRLPRSEGSIFRFYMFLILFAPFEVVAGILGPKVWSSRSWFTAPP